METNRKRLTGLKSFEYEHPFDKQALDILKKTRGFDLLLKKINEFYNFKVFRLNYLGSYFKVNSNNIKSIHNLLLEACSILDIKRIPELYIVRDFQINAGANGLDEPIVFLNSSIIDTCCDEEILWFLGHELGHLKSRHTNYSNLVDILPQLGSILGDITLGVGNLLAGTLYLAVMQWYRMSELTCDRAGLLCVQNIDFSISCLMKMAGIPDKFQITKEQFIDQSIEFENMDFESINQLIKLSTYINQTHPWTVMRTAELIKWKDYETIINRVRDINSSTTGNIYKYCTHCGERSINIDAEFCSKCGEGLR